METSAMLVGIIIVPITIKYRMNYQYYLSTRANSMTQEVYGFRDPRFQKLACIANQVIENYFASGFGNGIEACPNT